MASFPIRGTGCTAELPPVRIAVIRHQGETMLSPSNDVAPYLEAHDGWDVSVFDERDFGGALGGAAAFDVIVLGYNAAVFTPELQAALRAAPPAVPILLMHQREQSCFDFLREQLALEVVRLGDGVREALTPRERQDSFEPLLNWPHTALLTKDRFRATAIRGLSFAPGGAWRVVMEAQLPTQRVPVLLRSRADQHQRIVACSLLLRPAARPEHGRLLENLLVYCAFGWPDVGLVELEGEADAAARVRGYESGLRMWTERCVRVSIPEGRVLPLAEWPLRGVKRIVAPIELSPDVGELPGAAEWLQRGGELIRIDAEGRIAVAAELNDRFIVLQKWAMWFAARSQESWLGRLSAARAVLRMLEVVRADREQLPTGLRYELEPSRYSADATRLLASRVRRGNVDETISATATALDVDRLTGGTALAAFERRRMRAWLAQHLDGASRSDQLDILRCLADADLLASHLKSWNWLTTDAHTRVDALVAVRLREAVHACWPDGGEPADLLSGEALAALDGGQVVSSLAHGPLLCADFVAALYSRSPGTPGAEAPLFDPAKFPESVREALAHVDATDLYTGTADVRAVCAHTQAIFRHLERDPAGLRFLSDRGELPYSAAESVLAEAVKARDGEREARRDLPALGIAVLVLATITLGLAAVGLLALWGLSGLTVSIEPWWIVIPAVALPALLLAGLRWGILPPRERSERRDLRLGQNALAVAALALACVLGTLVWRLAVPNAPLAAFGPLSGLLAGAFCFAALAYAAYRVGLAPAWALRGAGLLSDPKTAFAAFTKKLGDLRPGETPPEP